MNLTGIKLVTTDMDGTLLNSKHEVSTLFFELFEELKNLDIIFVAASGRPYYSIVDKLSTIKGNIIVAAENGGLVVANDKTLLSTPLNLEGLKEIETEIDCHAHIHPVFCTKSKAFFKNSSVAILPILSEYYPNYQLINSIDDIENEILKIALFNNDDAQKLIYPLFERFKSNYKVIVSGQHWVDISHELANKGHAIKLIQNMYNITSEETLAFGDYDNDIEMLLQSKYSVAMKNANRTIKNIASFETKSNNDNGVELILEKLIKARKQFK
ncbi:HAD family hydrolase [Algibacter mikhailovii]|uniref:Haloacid dehalogenase n=1 Tax=Algibacter mikhailovii TaxID=425498 RepID=A0A918REQ4_9FLAO|nr:HAD family hydrolase [Algibacter mikhailovii]GGZ93866.1 haloacid dehalogenase [Algibacter mikhailovii]